MTVDISIEDDDDDDDDDDEDDDANEHVDGEFLISRRFLRSISLSFARNYICN